MGALYASTWTSFSIKSKQDINAVSSTLEKREREDRHLGYGVIGDEKHYVCECTLLRGHRNVIFVSLSGFRRFSPKQETKRRKSLPFLYILTTKRIPNINSTYIYHNKNPVWESIHLIFKSSFYQKSTLRWTKKPYFWHLIPASICSLKFQAMSLFHLIDPKLNKNFINK